MDILSEGDPGKMEYLICMTVIMSVPPLGLRKKRELLSGKPLTLSEVCISVCICGSVVVYKSLFHSMIAMILLHNHGSISYLFLQLEDV